MLNMMKEHIKDAAKYVASLGTGLRELFRSSGRPYERWRGFGLSRERAARQASYIPWHHTELPVQIDNYQMLTLQEIEAGKNYLVQCKTDITAINFDVLRSQLETASRTFNCQFVLVHPKFDLQEINAQMLPSKLTEVERFDLQDQIFHKLRRYEDTNSLDVNTERFLTGDLIDIMEELLASRRRKVSEVLSKKEFQFSAPQRMELRPLLMETIGKYDVDDMALQIHGFAKTQRANDVIECVEQYLREH